MMKSTLEGGDFNPNQDNGNYKEKTVYFDDVEVGTEITTLVKDPVTRTQIVRYAGASRDFNPMHHDEPLALSAGMKSVFAHGMISMAFLGQMVKDWCGHERMRKMKVRFVNQVWPGDIITCKGKVTCKYTENGRNLIEADISAQNQKDMIVTSGSALIELPVK